MKLFTHNFKRQVELHPNAIAVESSSQRISYSKLADEIDSIMRFLETQNVSCIAIYLPNSPAWIAFDLAAMFSGIVTVPVPHFFSKGQIEHLIQNAGVDAVITDTDNQTNILLDSTEFKPNSEIAVFNQPYLIKRVLRKTKNQELPQDCLKISYTSGTTGQPKGVVISAQQADKVVESLIKTLNANLDDRHLSALPFSLLLENIAGVYTVLASGGRCLIPSFSELGLTGSSSLNAEKFIKTILNHQPTTMITVPALAQALVQACKYLSIKIDSLRFVAVGGAPLSPSIIHQADDVGLPLFEGYGLTECSSVTTLNTPDQHKTGSVGKPLAHVEIEISNDNEILVSGALCSGYLSDIHKNSSNQQIEKWPTGDLGYIDKDGFLFITGRKRTAYSTAYGRNVSPEWIERELVIHPKIQQALIYGDGKPFNLAIIVPSQNTNNEELDCAINDLNHKLPDYARIGQWLMASEPYSINNQQLSAGGIMQRQQILDDYQVIIESVYQ